eukprot:14994670-Alexandrium_andersonii.AAC.1
MSAPPPSTRASLGTIAEEEAADASGGVPQWARLPERGTGSRSNTPSFDSAMSGTGGVPEQGRLPGTTSRPASLGPA